jgi:hypothetical protein
LSSAKLIIIKEVLLSTVTTPPLPSDSATLARHATSMIQTAANRIHGDAREKDREREN